MTTLPHEIWALITQFLSRYQVSVWYRIAHFTQRVLDTYPAVVPVWHVPGGHRYFPTAEQVRLYHLLSSTPQVLYVGHNPFGPYRIVTTLYYLAQHPQVAWLVSCHQIPTIRYHALQLVWPHDQVIVHAKHAIEKSLVDRTRILMEIGDHVGTSNRPLTPLAEWEILCVVSRRNCGWKSRMIRGARICDYVAVPGGMFCQEHTRFLTADNGEDITSLGIDPLLPVSPVPPSTMTYHIADAYRSLCDGDYLPDLLADDEHHFVPGRYAAFWQGLGTHVVCFCNMGRSGITVDPAISLILSESRQNVWKKDLHQVCDISRDNPAVYQFPYPTSTAHEIPYVTDLVLFDPEEVDTRRYRTTLAMAQYSATRHGPVRVHHIYTADVESNKLYGLLTTQHHLAGDGLQMPRRCSLSADEFSQELAQAGVHVVRH
jgi:hypothetical protein